MLNYQRVEHDRTICLSIPSTCEAWLVRLVPDWLDLFSRNVSQFMARKSAKSSCFEWVSSGFLSIPEMIPTDYISIIRHRSETGETNRKWDCLHMFTWFSSIEFDGRSIFGRTKTEQTGGLYKVFATRTTRRFAPRIGGGNPRATVGSDRVA
jgi:hypothetical protein